ncbi:MAG: class I SAM-dependent methyltransferase [Pseudomonadota bacterium]
MTATAPQVPLVGTPRVQPFGPEHAEVYEDFYRARGKDWVREANRVASLVRERCPEANSLLDVACGVGTHLERLQLLFDEVVGVEPSLAMRERAQGRLAQVQIHESDMRDFDLRRRFHAVTCLYTAVAYLPSVADLRRACAAMASHLTPGGVLIIEPWWLPEQFIPHYVGADLFEVAGRSIARMSHTVREGPLARMEVEWIIGQAGQGLRTFSELETFYMFSREELLAALDAAGCEAEWHERWVTGRSLVVGVRRPS